MATAVDVVADRLADQVPSRAVYRHGVPDGPAARYLFVYATAPLADSFELSDAQTLAGQTVWVSSCSSGESPQAASEAAWGAAKAADALRAWRPVLGSATWKVVHLSSQPATRDESLPDRTVMYAVDTYGCQFQF